MSDFETTLPPARCSSDLLELVNEFRESSGVKTESEAIRTLIRLGYYADSTNFLVFEMIGGEDPSDLVKEHPDAFSDFLEAMAVKFNSNDAEFDLVEVADATGIELKPDTIKALHRISMRNAGAEDVAKYLKVAPRLMEAVAEEQGEPDDLDELQESLEEIGTR